MNSLFKLCLSEKQISESWWSFFSYFLVSLSFKPSSSISPSSLLPPAPQRHWTVARIRSSAAGLSLSPGLGTKLIVNKHDTCVTRLWGAQQNSATTPTRCRISPAADTLGKVQQLNQKRWRYCEILEIAEILDETNKQKKHHAIFEWHSFGHSFLFVCCGTQNKSLAKRQWEVCSILMVCGWFWKIF